jgi:hypothetical protein
MIDCGDGPIQASAASIMAEAKLAFSYTRRSPGCTASAPGPRHRRCCCRWPGRSLPALSRPGRGFRPRAHPYGASRSISA